MDQPHNALKFLKKAETYYPKPGIDFYILKGRCLHLLGRSRSAEEAFLSAAQLLPQVRKQSDRDYLKYFISLHQEGLAVLNGFGFRIQPNVNFDDVSAHLKRNFPVE
ncbi:MAG: hypothetical protein AAGC70_13385 [Pseudomonadota bacterium]